MIETQAVVVFSIFDMRQSVRWLISESALQLLFCPRDIVALQVFYAQVGPGRYVGWIDAEGFLKRGHGFITRISLQINHRHPKIGLWALRLGLGGMSKADQSRIRVSPP